MVGDHYMDYQYVQKPITQMFLNGQTQNTCTITGNQIVCNGGATVGSCQSTNQSIEDF